MNLDRSIFYLIVGCINQGLTWLYGTILVIYLLLIDYSEELYFFRLATE